MTEDEADAKMAALLDVEVTKIEMINGRPKISHQMTIE
jgi:hypothetical protein